MVDRIEPTVAKYAGDWPAWGHRKVWAVARADGHDIGSPSSVKRAMAVRISSNPLHIRALHIRPSDVSSRATVETAFIDPPVRRNRVWQFDFPEFETEAGGVWRLGGTVDYWAKNALGCRVATTQTALDMIAALDVAVAQVSSCLAIGLSRTASMRPRTRSTSP